MLHQIMETRAVAIILVSLSSTASLAQLSQPNSAGVAMGHLHYYVGDVEANAQFWSALGGTTAELGPNQSARFPGVVVLLGEAESSANSEGSVVNHVAFRVQSLAAIEAAGFELERNAAYPGIASIFTPGGERIELFDSDATNLTFTVDAGEIDAISDRHNQNLTTPIASHHIHLYVPEDQVSAAKAWYVEHFGGVAGKRWRYEAVDFPGINLNFTAVPEALAATQGRMLDHIGFEVENLEAFCAALDAKGISFDRPYRQLPSGFGLAFLTDPWGTYIELTEGLRNTGN